MRSKLAVAALLISSTFALGACNYSAPRPPVDKPVGVTVDAARVTVLNSGQGERRKISYHDVGENQKVHFALTQGFAQDVVQAERVENFNTSNLKENTTSFDITGEVDKASDDPVQAPATRNAFMTISNPESNTVAVDSADGFQFGWRAGDSGQITSLRLAAPQAADDSARTAIEQAVNTLTSMPIVFPEDEVGQGAVWTVDSRIAGENSMLQTTTFTLEELHDNNVVLAVDIQQRPSLGALTFLDANNHEQQLNVLRSSSNTERGRVEINLTSPLPTQGEVSVTTRVVYGQNDSDVRVLQTTTTRMSFAPSTT